MNRRGVALGLVLGALVIGSALLTVAVFLGMQERRAAGSDRRLQRTLTRAEAALTDALAGWTPGLFSRRLLHPFDSLLVGNLDPSWYGVIRRLNRGLFLVSVAAEDRDSSTIATIATLSRLGWVVRVRPVTVENPAALQAGTVVVGSGARITGEDHAPADWDCPPPDSAIAGVLAGAIVRESGSVIEGSPAVLMSPGDSSFPAALEAAFELLATQATLVLPGGTWSPRPSASGMECNVSDPSNWGDPARTGICGDYWPIVHVLDDMQLGTGVGHGILLVDGNLQIVGSLRFAGLILVYGAVEIESRGQIDVEGGLVTSSAGTTARPLSGISVTYSKCMIGNALLSSGTLIPLRSRAWKQLF
ncbi:MAG TPA: hypothetical protein VJ816_11225 [Gemmatimonadales bacterium]|nr:hypothetical protein [Gemmatimonadales bacterium]